MSTIAIVGASSQIAKDLVHSLVTENRHRLLLYGRDVAAIGAWAEATMPSARLSVHPYADYDQEPHDLVINFVGVGNPQRAADMGASIFEVTRFYDDMVLAGLDRNPGRRYFFLSSGAAYGSTFMEPVDRDTQARIPINHILPQDLYGVAKLHAEVRHRARPHQSVVDIRVFNYVSRTQDVSARFFVTDVIRAIRDGQELVTSSDYMVRDYLHSRDFHALITSLQDAPAANCAVDCYSRAPIDKPELLAAFQERFSLRYRITPPSSAVAVNATGAKPHYYSLNRKAAEFGYAPSLSSREGLLLEAAALLESGAGPENLT